MLLNALPGTGNTIEGAGQALPLNLSDVMWGSSDGVADGGPSILLGGHWSVFTLPLMQCINPREALLSATDSGKSLLGTRLPIQLLCSSDKSRLGCSQHQSGSFKDLPCQEKGCLFRFALDWHKRHCTDWSNGILLGLVQSNFRK